MDQEKFPSLNQPSNANMPRDTVETLKQIQKQGLSISIVKPNTGSFSLPSTTSADNRVKPNVLTVDKPKILPRPQTTTDNKILQTRLTTADTRVSSGRVTTQSSFLDSKASPTQPRQSQPTVSESKSFSQAWNNPCTSAESKSQGPITTTAANKISTSQARMSQIHIPDNKTPVSRSNQSMLTETKSQGRALQGQRVIPNQQLADNKILSNDRMNPTSPPDAKVFTNQVRTGQQFVPTQEKSNPAQRVVTQKVADVKISSQVNAIKQVDKVPVANRVVQNVKILPESSQGKVRQNYNVKPEGKPIISTNPPMIVENKTIRLVATNVLESGSTRTAQCKTAQMRLHPSVSGVEGSTAVQTKMICTAVTKMVCYQSVPAQSDKGMILQGAKVATTDMIQKTATSFDVSESSHGNPMASRIATTKRTTTVMGSPAKKKCIKRIIPSSVEMCSKSQDGASPEDGNENNDQFFNNLKTSRTGLTITPVRASTPLVPTTQQNAVGMVRMPGELIDKDMLAWESSAMVAPQRGKPRSRGRRKYVEPVCLTLSSDDEEEHMQAPFNSIEEAMSQVHYENFPQESEGSKSGQSSPTYQDEENPESDDPQFPGVTNILPKSGEGRMHYEDEEEEGGMHYEDEEEKEMDEMEEEESMGEEEEEELEESEVDEEEEEEEEEVPPEEEEEPVMAKTPLDNMSTLKQPLHCRSIRIGSFKIHPKTVNSVLKVYLAVEGISFNAPMVSDTAQVVNIILKPCDVTQLFVHFGKCLPILFIFTTPTFAENIRKLLNMSTPEFSYYDPTSTDEKVKKITFLIDAINEEQRRFLRYTFLNEKKVKELDQKTANEILVKSTPSRTQVVRCEVAPQPFQVSQENVISVTAIQPTLQMLKVAVPIPPPVPPVTLFIYPPPPQTGGINITSDDLACLNEGEFLNDAIIDFYLKYVFYEKLSDYHREKTHIFSSYFYPRLTQKSERPRGEDAQKSVQLRRHNMVKTWTRHVDIFSKDFIVIPVNQNVHWFLAIICYPGLVPEAPEPPPKPEPKTVSKSSDNVTSTDDQEENKAVKEPNSTVDGINQNSDENSTASSNSMFESEEPDSEEPMPEAPDSSTHPDKNKRRKEAPCICIFDSLNGPNRSRIATMLREYLEVEWKMKKGTRKIFDKNTMQGFIMQCPQQNNYSDCGIYLLQYVESFFESPLPYFDNPIPNLSNWFPKEKVAKKRQELKDLIIALKKKYGSNTPTSTTTVTTPVRKQNVSDSVPSSPAQTLQTDNR